jgi:uncharacterized protein with PhoU and TrkA domain
MRPDPDDTARDAAERARRLQERADDLIYRAKETQRASQRRVEGSRRIMRITVKRGLG